MNSRNMKLLMSSLLLISQPAVIYQNAGWQEFVIDHHFKVSVPNKPSERPSLLHPITKMPNPTFSVRDNVETFRISFYCFSQTSTDPKDIETRLQAARNRTVVALTDESQGVAVKTEERTNHNGVSGLEIIMDSITTSYNGRIYASDDCVYLLLVSMPGNRSMSENGKRFLDSFERVHRSAV